MDEEGWSDFAEDEQSWDELKERSLSPTPPPKKKPRLEVGSLYLDLLEKEMQERASIEFIKKEMLENISNEQNAEYSVTTPYIPRAKVTPSMPYTPLETVSNVPPPAGYSLGGADSEADRSNFMNQKSEK